ncbi:splicing factor [Cyclospora cayetanensis]|uniref:Splicing factor n=1 Tax=Cyclospora cayetanensis TaxID=88456 RepID=A0A1D3CX03_9EIME|nr:splicing factor [Cyclospora cayetanensis]
MLIRGRMYSDQGGQWSPSPPPGPKCALEEPHDAQGVAFKVHLGYHKTKAAGGSHHMLSDDGAIPDDAGSCIAEKRLSGAKGEEDLGSAPGTPLTEAPEEEITWKGALLQLAVLVDVVTGGVAWECVAEDASLFPPGEGLEVEGEGAPRIHLQSIQKKNTDDQGVGPISPHGGPSAVLLQYETIQRYCRPGGSQQVCWDGFQWVKKSNDGDGLFDQHMNATRRARRLHVGNLPLSLDATEEDLKKFLWDALRKRTGKHVGAGACPVLHVWFSKERGSNYGFVEMATVEDAQAALLLSPLFWKGQQLRINRPTEWKKDAAEVNFAEVAGAADATLLESVAAAVGVAETTSDSSMLARLLCSLSEAQRRVIADFLAKSPTSFTKQGSLPVELLQCQIQTELLHGQPSRVVRITNPVPEAETAEELEETLSDILEEVNKRQDVLAALIITKELEKQLPAAEVGDIYVQFATGIQADKCILSFAGRMYDGHPLVIERFNEMVWRQTMQQHAKSFLTEILSRFM